MMGAGAIGYLGKDCRPQEMLEALQHAANNKYYMCKSTRAALTPELVDKYKLPPNGSPYNLTERQLQIVAMLLNGYETNDIAKELCLAPNTVSTHRKNIFKITKVHAVSGLLRLNRIHNFASQWWGDYTRMGKKK